MKRIYFIFIKIFAIIKWLFMYIHQLGYLTARVFEAR